MAYTISGLEAAILNGWGIAIDDAMAIAERIKTEFPDLGPRIDAFKTWLLSKVPANFEAIAAAVAAQIMSGVSGVDPGAFIGSV